LREGTAKVFAVPSIFGDHPDNCAR